MQIEAARKVFTVEEYYRMAEAGILKPDDRVELIDGEIVEMSPIGVRHAGCVNWANQALIAAFGGRAVVSVQNPVQLSDITEPQPDLALLRPRPDAYRGKKVETADALLVLEVADTTLAYDRNIKVPRYAAAGVPEVWIEDLEHDRLLVYRDPSGNSYRTARILGRDDSVSVGAFPDVVFKVSDLLG